MSLEKPNHALKRITDELHAAKRQLEVYERVSELPWSFHRGTLHERLEWCRAQHAYHAEHPPDEPLSREAKQDFDRACVAWYDEMLAQLAELVPASEVDRLVAERLSSLADDPPEEMVEAAVPWVREGRREVARTILSAALREGLSGSDSQGPEA